MVTIGMTQTHKRIMIPLNTFPIPFRNPKHPEVMLDLSLCRIVRPGRITKMLPVLLVQVAAVRNREQIIGKSHKNAANKYKNVKRGSE